MTDQNLGNKGRVALFASVAANMFLIAFTLGRFTTPGFGGHSMMFPPDMHGGLRPFIRQGGYMSPPPPFFGPDDLFTPDEMRADEIRMREDFDKIGVLRNEFAAQLEAGPVSKDDVLKHFARIDQVMDALKREAQARAADKISAMSQVERHEFAQSVLEKEDSR